MQDKLEKALEIFIEAQINSSKFRKITLRCYSAGHVPPIQRAGGAKSFSRPLPRASLRISLIHEEARDAAAGASRPPNGREVRAPTVRRGIPPVGRAGGSPPPI
jgi:hypothetical protein